jgi:hypothetical protein
MDFYNIKTIISSEYIKYLCIILCLLLSIFSTKNQHIDIVNHKDGLLLQLGLLITVIGDFCLVIKDFYILGVLFFILVQITYCIRYSNKNIKVTLIKMFIILLFIIFGYKIAILFIGRINILITISLFYGVCLLCSVNKAIKAWNNNIYTLKSKYRIVSGMVFFLLCDICVILSSISIFLPLSEYLMVGIQPIAYFLIWVFYLPSQLLLALSGNGRIQGF